MVIFNSYVSLPEGIASKRNMSSSMTQVLLEERGTGLGGKFFKMSRNEFRGKPFILAIFSQFLSKHINIQHIDAYLVGGLEHSFSTYRE